MTDCSLLLEVTVGDKDADPVFAGGVPELYERHLVPLIFEPYAVDLAARMESRREGSVLEVAAGTGVVTRVLADRLPIDVAITASDLNQPMVDHAASLGTSRPVTWRQADVMDLPFPDSSFDAVICQFGVMFFPDRSMAFAEINRVLRPGGVFLFNTWDRNSTNEFADVVTDAAATVFPDDPPRFLARTPHGYFDHAQIQHDVADGGFDERATAIEVLEARSRADSCEIPAIAYCQGTPLRNEIEARDPNGLARATEVATAALRARFGDGPIEGRISAVVVTAR